MDRQITKRFAFMCALLRKGITSGAMLTVVALGVAVQAQAQRPPTAVELESWGKAIVKTPRPKKACFVAKYPETVWHEVACKPPTLKLFPPKRGKGIRFETVGGPNGVDFVPGVTGHSFEAEGSFDAGTTVGSECSVPCDESTDICPANPTCSIPGSVANDYSLQMNTQTFSGTSACGGAPAAGAWGQCAGWQQFVYESDGSGGTIQYWMVPYGPQGSTCPSGWNSFSYSATASDPNPNVFCYYIVGASNPAPAVSPTDLQSIKVIGSAAGVHGADDTLTVTVSGTAYSSPGDNFFPDLNTHWQETEFNIFGDGYDSQAVFSSGSTVVVRVGVDNGTIAPPNCNDESFTGETNNLTLVNTPPTAFPGTLPALVFSESFPAAPGAPATCADATSVGEEYLRGVPRLPGRGGRRPPVSITVTPANPSVPLRTTQQFTATGKYSDGSTQDLTSTVTWSSSAPDVATISNTSGSQGLTTATGLGPTTIEASLDAINGSTTLTVTLADDAPS